MTELYTLSRRYLELMKTSRTVWRREADKAFMKAGFSLSTATCFLSITSLGEGVRQVAIADDIGIKAPTLVRQLDILESAGYIARQDAPEDRRVKLVFLTDAGQELVKKIDGIMCELIGDMMGGLTAEEIRVASKVFEQVLINAEKLNAKDA